MQVESETLIVTLENGTSFARSTLDDAENRRLMAAAAAEAFGRHLKVEFRFQNRSIPPGVSGSTQLTTGQGEPIQPSMPRPRETASPERSVTPSDQGSPRRHPLVQKAVELFGGEVIRVSEKEPGQDAIGERG